MNDKTQYRVEQVKARTKKLHRQGENHLLWLLSSICFVLAVSLVGMFGAITSSFSFYTPTIGGFGAILLWGGADGYVLTGVLSFTAGVIITVLCLRSQWKKKHVSETSDKK